MPPPGEFAVQWHDAGSGTWVMNVPDGVVIRCDVLHKVWMEVAQSYEQHVSAVGMTFLPDVEYDPDTKNDDEHLTIAPLNPRLTS